MTEVSTSLRVIYPGSFDPIHNGHIDVIEQTKDLFGSVVVAIMHNPDKPSGLFTVAERVELARSAVADLAGVTVDSYTGLAVQAAERAAANFIVKGLRTAGEVEVTMGLRPGDTILFSGTHKVSEGSKIVAAPRDNSGQALRPPEPGTDGGEGT